MDSLQILLIVFPFIISLTDDKQLNLQSITNLTLNIRFHITIQIRFVPPPLNYQWRGKTVEVPVRGTGYWCRDESRGTCTHETYVCWDWVSPMTSRKRDTRSESVPSSTSRRRRGNVKKCGTITLLFRSIFCGKWHPGVNPIFFFLSENVHTFFLSFPYGFTITIHKDLHLSAVYLLKDRKIGIKD